MRHLARQTIGWRRTEVGAVGCRPIAARYASARTRTIAAVLALEFDRRITEVIRDAVLLQKRLESYVLLLNLVTLPG